MPGRRLYGRLSIKYAKLDVTSVWIGASMSSFPGKDDSVVIKMYVTMRMKSRQAVSYAGKC